MGAVTKVPLLAWQVPQHQQGEQQEAQQHLESWNILGEGVTILKSLPEEIYSMFGMNMISRWSRWQKLHGKKRLKRNNLRHQMLEVRQAAVGRR